MYGSMVQVTRCRSPGKCLLSTEYSLLSVYRCSEALNGVFKYWLVTSLYSPDLVFTSH